MLLARNGHCDGKAPGLLHVLVGEPMASCPTGMGKDDPEVMWMATQLPGPHGQGAIDDMSARDLPPRWQAAYEMAKVWREVWLSKAVAS